MKQSAFFLALLGIILCAVPASATLIFQDNFQGYTIANPAASPLTPAVANITWTYVDPGGGITANNHRTYDAPLATGAQLGSRGWISNENNGKLRGTISLATLPYSNGQYTLTFLVAPESSVTTTQLNLSYALTSSAGSLSFVSGNNLDNSITFTGLSGTFSQMGAATGKSNNRKFELKFNGTGLSTSDTLTFDITRVNSTGNTTAFVFVDDVALDVVPEPTSMILLALAGVFGVVFFRRKK